ncbi:EpsG family protein [Pseudomonas sp. efr-133-TYG-5]|uniref:EpsG family protein n=1 Tax=Pseudomonas sp. efr-133-TYG-5 TaxID=3040310 RepID=UPI002556E8B4|nr:EpsG family protein [Pseudomonas sp. efr-133-TYG-5]
MTQYNIVYGLVWLLAILSLRKNSQPSVYLYLLQVMLLAFFVGFKFQTGYDWPIYEAHYAAVANGEAFYLEFEFGYGWLVQIATSMGLTFEQFSAFISIVEVLFIAFAVRRFFPGYCLVVMAVMYSVPDFYLIPTFSLLRQGLAVSIFLIGVYKFFSGNKIIGFVLFAIACSFHYSVAGGVLLLILVSTVPLSRVTFLLVFLISVMLYISSFDIIRGIVEVLIVYVNPKYMIYLDRDVFNASLAYRGAFALVSLVFFVCIYTAWLKRDSFAGEQRYERTSVLTYKLAFLGLLVPLIIFGFPTLSTRYQFFFAIFLVGGALEALQKLTYASRFVMVFLIAIIAYLPFYRFLSSPLSIVYIPYQSQMFYDHTNSTGQDRTNDLLNQLDVLWSK